MGKKIFVSYKYYDDQVYDIKKDGSTIVRDYVSIFENKLKNSYDIYKGEHDNEDLSDLSEDTIWEKLKNKIYDSSVTVIFISPGMKEAGKKEKNQWIPWEISYSLKEVSRKNTNNENVTSRTNAMVAVVLPDNNNSYSYYLENKTCCSTGCRMHHTNILFSIIKKNMFNYKLANKKKCICNDVIFLGDYSYIEAVKWEDFIGNYQFYIEKACYRQDDIDNYEIYKDVL